MSKIQVNKVEQPKLTKYDSSVLDLAFAMDCTGSMGSYIHTAQKNIRKIVEDIVANEKSDIHLALVEYRDHPPQDSSFVTRTHDFTGSVSKMKGWLDGCSASGGGDGPEAVADALHDVLKLTWRPNATKICVLISDAPPHGLDRCGDGFPNGCPAGIDPMEVTRKIAEKGITLYSVGCEPAINPYKEFFMAIAFLTGGQYVPLTGAGLLTQVIIGGAQEEISLDQWMADVDEEVQRDLNAGREIDDDEISRRIQEKLVVKGAKSKQLHYNDAALAAPTDSAKKLSKFTNMMDIQKNFTSDQNFDGPQLARGGPPMARGGPPPSFALMTNCYGAPAPPPPGAFEYLGGFASGSAPPPPPSDSYNVVESEMSYSQVSRMVQKSKAKNMAAFSKKS